MRGEQLFPFEAAVVEAGLGSMMPAYCDVDGVACHASRELLTTILREEWGFDGIVVSDYVGIEMLATQHRLTADAAVAAGMALSAGVDIELPRSVAFAEPLLGAIGAGTVSEDLVDTAVARVLRAKLRLGLFEQPYVEAPTAEFLAELGVDESRVAQRLAVRSLVLVENDGVLPLSPGLERVAVIGPIADSARDLLGDYSHLVHIETLLEMRDGDNALGFPITDEVVSTDELSGIQTVLGAIRERLPAARVTHARGCEIREGTDDQLAEAVAVAAGSDVAIVVVGERSGLTFDATTGESRDRRDLALLGRQEELVLAVAATGTPVILVVVSGRPLALERVAGASAAVLLAWVPGEAGAAAIADVLTGRADPGGKLPVTMLRHVGQVPLTYRHHPSGGRSNWKGDHVDGPVAPLWPLGFGLGYTTFELSSLRVSSTTLATDGGEVLVEVDIANTGQRSGDEVVQLYVRDEEATVARPVIELAGFARVTLTPAERRVVAFRLSAEQFSYVGADGRRVIEPGSVRLMAGTSSASLPLDATLQLTGDTVHLPSRRRFLTQTTVT
jgi:beta-glucosidase